MLIQVSSLLDLGLVHQVIDRAEKEGCNLLETGSEVARKLGGAPARASLETKARQNLETWSTRGLGLAGVGLLLPKREGQGGMDLRAMGEP